MKLRIKKISIEKNKKIIESLTFTDHLNIVRGSMELYCVIEALLGVQRPQAKPNDINFFAIVELDSVYYIRGRKEQGDSAFTISVRRENEETISYEDYRNLLRQNDETDDSIFFRCFKRQDYPHKLLKYKDIIQYYPDGEFARRTNGYGTTRSFRGFIMNYINHFKPIRLRENKDLFLKLSKEGEFKVGYLDSDEELCLSESENMLYHYLSFISIADFWARAEKIRNLNRVIKPLIVSRFVEFLDESVDMGEIIRCSKKAARQVILFDN